MHIEPYRVFYFVAKNGSLTRAAEELYTSQPAVSQAIRQLEQRLGLKLFFRNPRGVTLTPEGQVLYGYVTQGYNFFLMGERAVKDMLSLQRGEIRIGGSDTLCKYFLLPILQKFNRSYPEVKIKVTNRTTPESLDLLKRGEVDMSLVHLPLPGENFRIATVRGIQDCFMVGERYKGLTHSPVSLVDIANYPLLLLEQGTNTRRFFDEWTRQYGLSLSPEAELGSVDLLVEFARIGLGLAFVIKEFVQAEFDQGLLYEVKLKEPIPTRAIGMATNRDVPLSRAAEEFLRMVMEEAGRR